jgi:putative ATP-dependent endonuclease of the OLD family
MYITRVYIEGFKQFKKFELCPNPGFNIVVGDNDTGKSSLLDAIGLALTGQYEGRLVQHFIDPYLFNLENVASYFAERRKGRQCNPPRVYIEVYLAPDPSNPALSKISGSNNLKGESCPGLKIEIRVLNGEVEALKEYASDESNPEVLPVEFYGTTWMSFDNNQGHSRSLPFKVAKIDASMAQVHRGHSRYISQRMADVLTDNQRRDLSLAYKRLRHDFTQLPGVAAINQGLASRSIPATTKRLTVQMDMSARSSWDSTIAPHLDDLPFDCAGKGEQCHVQLRLAVAGQERARIFLVEEPENHLSHSKLNALLRDIEEDCADRQMIVSTHSAYVLNKLGIDKLILISREGKTASLNELTSETKNYFMKLPGYDTLRLILSKKSILVEGASDELIVQRAYMDQHGKRPIEDGVDVISVRGISFKRFLEVAAILNVHVRVVADNDGRVQSLREKYAGYLDGEHPNIAICYDSDETCETLESQLLKTNFLASVNSILGKQCANEVELLEYMSKNKTMCALKFFESEVPWSAPGYIIDAIK